MLAMLAQYFSQKTAVPDPTRPPSSLPMVAQIRVTSLPMTEGKMQAALSAMKKTKAMGPDG